MLVLAPASAAPRLDKAPAAVEAPVPPSVKGRGPGVPLGGDWVGLVKASTICRVNKETAAKLSRAIRKRGPFLKERFFSIVYVFIFIEQPET